MSRDAGEPFSADELALLRAELGARAASAGAATFLAEVARILAAAAYTAPWQRDSAEVRNELARLTRACQAFNEALGSVDPAVASLMDAYRAELNPARVRFDDLRDALQDSVSTLAAGATYAARHFERGRGQRDADERRAALREHLAGAYLTAFPEASIGPDSVFARFFEALQGIRRIV